MFHKATRKIVKEIDPYGCTLIPVASPYYSDCYKPLNIIKKKKRAFFFMKDRYIPTPVTVADILEDGKDLDFVLESSSFSDYSASSRILASGEVGVSICDVDAGLHASVGTTSSMSAFKMIKRGISDKMLLEVTRDRKIDRGHSFVKQLYGDILFIISEVVETDRQCNLNSIFEARSGSEVPINIVKAKAGVAAKVQQELSFPGGTTIAFKVSKLEITRDNTLDVDWQEVLQSNMLAFVHERPEIPLTEINTMSKETSLLFLNTFLEILGNCDYLPVLETMLDQICGSLQPDLQVLERLEEENRACVEKLLDLLGIRKADPPGQPLTLTPQQNGIITTVNIFIESLNELNPDVLILLANSVEMKIISIQIKLFEKIEENFFLSSAPRMKRESIGEVQETEETLETLALQLSDEMFEITQRILEEFGLHLMRENGSITYKKHHGERNVFFSIFAALSILSALDK
ncbi:gasdermin-A-like [Scyliorhinus torazame]|uniref:gasdermin-A-like n=1 Tax=Scyliorhinus torazame TaxID=75743 RepID=UPI003B5B3560